MTSIREGEHARLPCRPSLCPKNNLFGFKWSKHSPTQHYEILTHNVRFQEIIYSKKNIDRIDQKNIFINPNISDSDLIIQNARPSDEGDYVCDVICTNPAFKETRIVKLRVEEGK